MNSHSIWNASELGLTPAIELNRKSVLAQNSFVDDCIGKATSLNRRARYLADEARSNYEAVSARITQSLERVKSAQRSIVSHQFEQLKKNDKKNGVLAGDGNDDYAYLKLEDHYETFLSDEGISSRNKQLIMLRLSIVCRERGKTAEAALLEEKFVAGQIASPGGSPGFFELLGF